MDTIVSKTKDNRIYTKLKFVKSDKTGAVVSFVSQHPATGQIRGVRQNESVPKKICVMDKLLAPYILLNVLYDCALVPMNGRDGYVVVEANISQFKATISTIYVPKAVYMIECRFGHKIICFDPKDGERKTERNLKLCLDLLEKRVDIKDHDDVIAEFEDAAQKLLKHYRKDGFYYKE